MIVYTAIFGGYDDLQPPLAPGDVKHVCFNDSGARVEGWEIRRVAAPYGPARTARYYKLLPHESFTDDITIWTDGRLRFKVPPQQIVDEWLGDADFALFKHPSRGCLYDEATRCIVKKKDAREKIEDQVESYRKAGMPEKFGLLETGVVIRRNTQQMRELGHRWWREVERHSRRDQISLPYVLWQMQIWPKMIPGSVVHHDWVECMPHKK